MDQTTIQRPYQVRHPSGEQANDAEIATPTRHKLYEAAYQAYPSVTRQEARNIVDHMLDEIANRLFQGLLVRLHGFDAIDVHAKRKHIGRNTRGADALQGVERLVLTFRPSQMLTITINIGSDKNASQT